MTPALSPLVVFSVPPAYEPRVDKDGSRGMREGLCLVRLNPMGLVRTCVSSIVAAVDVTEGGAAWDFPMEMRRGAPAGE